MNHLFKSNKRFSAVSESQGINSSVDESDSWHLQSQKANREDPSRVDEKQVNSPPLIFGSKEVKSCRNGNSAV